MKQIILKEVVSIEATEKGFFIEFRLEGSKSIFYGEMKQKENKEFSFNNSSWKDTGRSRMSHHRFETSEEKELYKQLKKHPETRFVLLHK